MRSYDRLTPAVLRRPVELGQPKCGDTHPEVAGVMFGVPRERPLSPVSVPHLGGSLQETVLPGIATRGVRDRLGTGPVARAGRHEVRRSVSPKARRVERPESDHPEPSGGIPRGSVRFVAPPLPRTAPRGGAAPSFRGWKYFTSSSGRERRRCRGPPRAAQPRAGEGGRSGATASSAAGNAGGGPAPRG